MQTLTNSHFIIIICLQSYNLIAFYETFFYLFKIREDIFL